MKTETLSILQRVQNGEITPQIAQEQLFVLFGVVGRSEQLPPNPITDKEYKKLMKSLYPKDNSKRFRR